MSITLPSRADILTSAISYFQKAHSDPITGATPPMGPRSFCGQEARALANLLADVLGAVGAADDDAIPGTYVDSEGVTRTRNSTLSLDDWAYALGLPSSTPGVFGRKGAQAASGGGATASGTPGVTVFTNAQLTDPSGQIIFQIGVGFTMPMGGTQPVVISAVTPGQQGNLDVGTILRWSSPPPGLAATVTLTTALTGGYDKEDDVTLALRIVQKLQSPLRGGTAADYRFWCENAFDTSGRPLAIDRAYPLPGRNGTGSIDVCITQAGSGSGRDPGATVANQVDAYMETVRPVGDGGVRIVRPYFDPSQKLGIRVRIQAATGYVFDWDDGQGGSPAATSTGSATTSLILNTSGPPAALQTAVDAGNQPRVQLSLDVLPFLARVTAYALNTPTTGKCTLTLDTPLTDNLGNAVTPGAGISVYAGGPAVLPVSLAVLSYVDSVGPSRGSGAAPATDVWEDSVTVARIGKAAILATDAAGQPVCVTSPNIGDVGGIATLPGVLIKIGSGSETAQDFQLFDNDLTHGPQLPQVSSILVHKGGA